MKHSSTNIGVRAGNFPTTHWSVLAAIKAGTIETRLELLNPLIERYWKPLYLCVRGYGYDNEEAKDIVQEFFVSCLAKELWDRADPKRGRFRTFLLSCMSNFIKNIKRAANAKRRRPKGGILSLDDLMSRDDIAFQPPDMETPEAIFNRAWAVELVMRVLDQLRDECQANEEKKDHYELFRRWIIEPLLEGIDPPPLAELASKMGLTEKQASNRILTARRAYQRLLRDEIRIFAASEEEVAEEIQNIFRVLEKEK